MTLRCPVLCFFILISSLVSVNSLKAQSWDELRKDRSSWIIGEGYGSSAREADQYALEDLASQIRVNVSSELTLRSGNVQKRTGRRMKETSVDSLDAIISTYSQVTLNDCRRVIVENGPKKYHIVRYIAVSDVARVFAEREQKVRYMLDVAQKAESELKMDAALKNYYWAQILLNTLPSPSTLEYYDADGNSQILSVWVPGKISGILEGLSFEFGSFVSEDRTLGTVQATYKGEPVTSVDYSYWDNITWSILTAARDGLGTVEFRLDALPSSIDIKVEYQYDNELHQDPEIENIVSIMRPVNFPEAYKTGIPVRENPKAATVRYNEAAGAESVSVLESVPASDVSECREVIGSVLEAMKSADSSSVRGLFTSEGYDEYRKLLLYGSARVLDTAGMKFLKFKDEIYCRSIPMDFYFKGNDRHFVEDVVFICNSAGLVSGITFALENRTVEDILAKSRWKDESKMQLISFLESYKTAFAMKNLDYLSSIFSEDALIITGRVVKRTRVENQVTLRDEYVVYNRQSKAEYMENLARSFASKEYINLKFSNTTVGSWREGLFGIMLKQDYYSSNYGDTGYLYLYLDLRDSDRPIIHVRTWQPEPSADVDSLTGLYGPGNF